LSTASHFLNQCNSSSASRAQKASGDASASRRSASYSASDLTRARSAKCAGGGKTRSSCSTDSMLVVVEDMTASEPSP
jgi:hypothetical protein